jgi:hypothetical protein
MAWLKIPANIFINAEGQKMKPIRFGAPGEEKLGTGKTLRQGEDPARGGNPALRRAARELLERIPRRSPVILTNSLKRPWSKGGLSSRVAD